MKTAKSLSYRDIATSEQSHQIKCYLKLYNSNGLSSPEAHLPSNYEILGIFGNNQTKTHFCAKP